MLHAFWSLNRGPGLWAEDSGKVVKSRDQGLKAARPHPFAASADVVAALAAGELGSTPLLLPSLRHAPLDSPEIVRITPRPASSTGPSLLPWTVPVVWVNPAAVIASGDELGQGLASTLFPERFPDDEIDSRGDVRIAASVRFLGEVGRFADELAERGRVLPGIAWASNESDDSLVAEARWRAVLRGPDALAFGDLIASMPPVFRAEPGSEDAGELAASALHAFTDAAVRARLPRELPMLPPHRGRKPLQPRAAEAWLEALHMADARVQVPAQAVGELEQGLAPWNEYARESNAPARATFRLSEIPGTEDVGEDPLLSADVPEHASAAGASLEVPAWRLEFLLQSSADPSLLVAAEQVWRDGGALARWLGRPQEVLLAELGKAVRVYPALEPGLRQSRPAGLNLDSSDAFAFLQDGAPALDEAGFGVLLPSWWDKRTKLGLKLSASTPMEDGTGTAPAFGREQLCDFQWSIAVGDHTLTDEEISALAEAKAPLVRLRGQWMTVNAEQLRLGIDFLQREEAGRGTVADVLRLAAAHPDELELPLEVAGVTADGWLGALLDGSADARIQPVSPPASFRATLRPYQERGLAWLNFLATLGVGACLADDMGLGKTVQLLALEAVHREANAEAGPTLLVCPMSLIGNWEAEAAKFAPGLRLRVHHGSDRLRGEDFGAGLDGIDILITTYTTLTRDLELFEAVTWNRVVLDEAQAVKNRLSRAAKAVKRLTATHRIALTGTPVENRLGEMFSIMDFLNPGILGSAELFRTRYSIPIERHRDPAAAERVRALTRPYLLRRVKTDPAIIDDLPEKIEIKQYYTLTNEQASLYQSVVDDMMEKIEESDGIARRGNVLAAMAKLKQICNHPAQLLHDRSAVGQRSGKVIRLEEILEEIIAEGDKVLCFTQYTEFAEMLVPHLAARFDTDVAYLHGGTSRQNRTELVRRFQSDDGPPIFLLSLKAGGTGLNLTAANHVIHLDRWWNPAVENQATDRAFRIGQKRRVQVRKFICRGTLEERIDNMIEEKAALANMVVGDGEGWLTELSTQSLRELFALSKEAVSE
ncbi:DEAD/DEAH box helicase [Pseudarthrobacter sp. AL07]|uniref:DEAD/DEAH box helicase n=1 Tax=unclassified Pseudarthrobacter TaxID=2647000 RepID=UPI00249B58F6|nr:MULTISPECIES: DEAD/DEAH box helicase [unclassified Pseudarthrobacter]MDI3193236.1 DEAD/DEAH box helicase [Pseudarthrobacter sp. AL20]MDI3206944.1 DEAD/DEAH box helicase [Pseudarthrobacter sp. AL07]